MSSVDTAQLDPILAEASAQLAAMNGLLVPTTETQPPLTGIEYVYNSPNTKFPLQPFETQYGLTQDVFTTDFTKDAGTVDLKLTYGPCSRPGSPGTNFWPPSSLMPNGASQTSAGLVLTVAGAIGDGDLLSAMVMADAQGISPSVQSGSGGGEAMLGPVSSYTGLKGWAYGGSHCTGVCITASNDVRDYPGVGSDGPACWSLPMEYLQWVLASDQGKSCTSFNYGELDFFEIGAGLVNGVTVLQVCTFLNSWGVGGGTYPACNFYHAGMSYNGPRYNLPPGFDLTKPTWFHTVKLTSADNGGNGVVFYRYINGVLMPDATVSMTNGKFPPDQLALFEAQHERLILGGRCSTNSPLTFLAATVRQKPGANGVVIY